jgi:genome maintenance exonuclease 1
VYAGTTDCVGIHEGREAIMDFKQSNKVKKRENISGYFLQLCAYAEAHNELYGTNINTGVILMCVKPEMDANQNVKSTPQYLEFILEGSEFEHYRNLWWQRLEQYYSKV